MYYNIYFMRFKDSLLFFWAHIRDLAGSNGGVSGDEDLATVVTILALFVDMKSLVQYANFFSRLVDFPLKSAKKNFAYSPSLEIDWSSWGYICGYSYNGVVAEVIGAPYCAT